MKIGNNNYDEGSGNVPWRGEACAGRDIEFFPNPFSAISVYNIKTSAINGLFIYEITTATTRKVNVSKEEQHIFNNNTNYDNNN